MNDKAPPTEFLIPERPQPDSKQSYCEVWQRQLEQWESYVEGLEADDDVDQNVVMWLKGALQDVKEAVAKLRADERWMELVPECEQAWRRFIDVFKSSRDQLGSFTDAAQDISTFEGK